jgi:hypothetical protein
VRQALAPILFDDHDRAAAQAQRSSPVSKATVSPAALRKHKTKRTDDGLPVHSFRSLLADLATLTRNQVRFATGSTFTMLATPTSCSNTPSTSSASLQQPTCSQKNRTETWPNPSRVNDLPLSEGVKFRLEIDGNHDLTRLALR